MVVEVILRDINAKINPYINVSQMIPSLDVIHPKKNNI